MKLNVSKSRQKEKRTETPQADVIRAELPLARWLWWVNYFKVIFLSTCAHVYRDFEIQTLNSEKEFGPPASLWFPKVSCTYPMLSTKH